MNDLNDRQVRLDLITQGVVQDAVAVLGARLYKIILYGSYARGDFDDESDIDIMVILECDAEEIKKHRKDIIHIASKESLVNNIEVSLITVSRDVFESRVDILPFYQNVLREGVVLYG